MSTVVCRVDGSDQLVEALSNSECNILGLAEASCKPKEIAAFLDWDGSGTMPIQVRVSAHQAISSNKLLPVPLSPVC